MNVSKITNPARPLVTAVKRTLARLGLLHTCIIMSRPTPDAKHAISKP